MDPIANTAPAQALWAHWMGAVAQCMQQRQAHPARTVVLLPFAQLMPLARRHWAATAGSGFAPRFETTRNWASAHAPAPAAHEITLDMGRDLLTARDWLDRAGLGRQSQLLASRLVEAAWQLAPLAAAQPTAGRAAWARAAVQAAAVQDAPVLALEAAVARIAIEWAAACGYASDVLQGEAVQASLDVLVVAEGLQPDPVAHSLARAMGERAVCLPLPAPGPAGQLALHEAQDPSDEAERAAACVLRHVEAGRLPVALGAIDRVLTRRVRAMLEARGVAMRDETGWKLSTTRAAAHVMGALRACAWHASSDTVLDWLKRRPARRCAWPPSSGWCGARACATGARCPALPTPARGRPPRWRRRRRPGARPCRRRAAWPSGWRRFRNCWRSAGRRGWGGST